MATTRRDELDAKAKTFMQQAETNPPLLGKRTALDAKVMAFMFHAEKVAKLQNEQTMGELQEMAEAGQVPQPSQADATAVRTMIEQPAFGNVEMDPDLLKFTEEPAPAQSTGTGSLLQKLQAQGASYEEIDRMMPQLTRSLKSRRLSVSERLSDVGTGLADFTKSAVDELTPNFVKGAYNRSLTGVAHEIAFGQPAFDLSGWEPNVIEDIAATVLSFIMPLDVATLGAGSAMGKGMVRVVKSGLVRRLVNYGVRKEVAERAVEKASETALGRMVSSGATTAQTLGTYEAAFPAISGEDLEVIGKSYARGSALGFILGGTTGLTARWGRSIRRLSNGGYVYQQSLPGKAAQVGAEIGAFAAGGPQVESMFEGEGNLVMPTLEDLTHATGIVIGLKLQGLASNWTKSKVQEHLYSIVAEKGRSLGEAVQELLRDPKILESILQREPEQAAENVETARKKILEGGQPEMPKDLDPELRQIWDQAQAGDERLDQRLQEAGYSPEDISIMEPAEKAYWASGGQIGWLKQAEQGESWAKEPWEMTRQEYTEANMPSQSMGGGVSEHILARHHAIEVQKALAEGKRPTSDIVLQSDEILGKDSEYPAEVLADYPDLAKKHQTTKTGAEDAKGLREDEGQVPPRGSDVEGGKDTGGKDLEQQTPEKPGDQKTPEVVKPKAAENFRDLPESNDEFLDMNIGKYHERFDEVTGVMEKAQADAKEKAEPLWQELEDLKGKGRKKAIVERRKELKQQIAEIHEEARQLEQFREEQWIAENERLLDVVQEIAKKDKRLPKDVDIESLAMELAEMALEDRWRDAYRTDRKTFRELYEQIVQEELEEAPGEPPKEKVDVNSEEFEQQIDREIEELGTREVGLPANLKPLKDKKRYLQKLLDVEAAELEDQDRSLKSYREYRKRIASEGDIIGDDGYKLSVNLDLIKNHITYHGGVLEAIEKEVQRVRKEIETGKKQPRTKPKTKKPTTRKPEKPTEPPKDVETPETATEDIIEGKRESKLGMKEFKKRMVAELDKAIKKSSERPEGLTWLAERVLKLEKNYAAARNDARRETVREDLRIAKNALEEARKKHGVGFVNIHIPGDGDFTIENTRQSLEAVRKKVRGLPATIGPKPEKPPTEPGAGKTPHETKYVAILPDTEVEGGKYTSPVPASPRPLKKPPESVKFKKPGIPLWEMGGHFAVLKSAMKPPMKPRYDETRPPFDPKNGKGIIKDAIQAENLQPLEEVARLHLNDAPTMAVFYDGKRKHFFSADYIDYFHRHIKDFGLWSDKNPASAAVMVSGKKKVGILMPMRGGDVGDKLRIKLKESEGVEKKSATPKGADAMPIVRGHVDAYSEYLKKEMEGRISKRRIGPREITDYLSKAFSTPIRSGRTGRAAGLHYPDWNMTRVKDLRDLPVTSHEVAHRIDKMFDLRHTLFKGDSELADLDYNQNARRTKEGFAEYMRHWLTESMDVTKVAPKFTEKWNTWLKDHPEIKEKLETARDMIREWRKQGADNRVLSQIDIKNKGLPLPLKEKLTRKLRRAGYLGVDDLLVLEHAEREIRGMKPGDKLDPKKIPPQSSPTMIARDVAKKAYAKARQMVIDGTFDFSGKRTGISLRAVLEPVADHLNEFLVYGYAKRGIELHERGKNPGIDYGDAKYIVNKYESPDHPLRENFIKSLGELTGFADRVLQYVVDAGVLSPAEAKHMRELNQYYIPLKRVMDDGVWTGPRTGGRRLSNLGQPVKRLKGSGRAIVNPLESIVKQTAEMISIADKVRVGRALVELAEKHNFSGKWVFKVKTPQRRVRIDPVKAIKQMLDKGMIDIDDIPEMNTQGRMLDFYINQAQYMGHENIVSFWINGERKFYELDADLHGAMKGLDTYFAPPVVDVLFGKPARMVRLGATGVNLGFTLITNPIRDAMTLSLQTDYIKSYRLLDSLMRGFWTRTPWGTESQENMKRLWLRSGGDMANLLGLDRKTFQRTVNEALASKKTRKAMNILGHPIDALREVLSVSEAGPRLAEFEAAYKAGEKLYGKGSVSARIMAANAAADVTINFSRMGKYGAVLNQIIPFFNANVQGMARFYRMGRQHPVRAAVKGIGMLTIPTLVLWDEHKDEKWYQDLPDWDKYGFWHFNLGKTSDQEDVILRLPRPFEWGVGFASMPEAVMNYWYNKEPDAFKSAMKEMFGQLLPPIMPTTVRTPVEVWANYDFFRDRPIDPHWEVEYTKASPDLRYSEWTTETAKFIGKTFRMSPRKIEHTIEGLTGGLGEDVIRFAETGYKRIEGQQDLFAFEHPADIPVGGRLFSRTKTTEESEARIEAEYRRTKGEINRLDRLAEDENRPELRERADKLIEEWNKKHPDWPI